MSYDTGVRRVSILGADVINDIVDEAHRAHVKHGSQSMLYGTDDKSLRIAVEEVGEVARAMNERALGNYSSEIMYRSDLRKELIQCAAMYATWVAKLDATEKEQ